jgi:tetratricopeptide (TPR) repeat protein
MGEGRYADAAQSFRRALAKSKLAERTRVVEALVTALEASGDKAACAQTSVEETATGPRDARFANLVAIGILCALEGDKAALPTLQARAREAIATGDALGADDRSSLYELLVETEADAAAKRKIAGEWLAFLEGEAARATTPEARAAFDAHRLSAAIALGEPARAIPALLASEKSLPDDYNAPARLAIAYKELGRFDEALAAVERARKKVYGPRRLRVEETAAEILVKKGEVQAARQVLDAALQFSQTLPKTPRTDKAIERLKKKRDKL